MEAAADATWKGFSLAERDRRWSTVRANAAKDGLDCVFVPLCLDGRNLHLSLEQAHGTRSDVRYLTQMQNGSIVLPTDGRPPIFINEDGEGNAWVSQARRTAEHGWGPAMAQALLDLGMERGRIGVTGLGRGKVTHGRAISGVVNHSAFADVTSRLPDATFVDANDVVGYARYSKSAEEVACLRRGAEIANAGIDRMIELAQPGRDETELYAGVMERMLELGSEYYPLALYAAPASDDRPPRFEDPPVGRTLKTGYLLTHETDAVWGGLIAQEMQPIVLGPVPEPFKPLIDLQREMYETGLEMMRPGTIFADLIDRINGMGPARGLSSIILMHGRGYGDDAPLLTPQDRRAEHIRNLEIQEGNVWVWKPIALDADERRQFSWGGCVVITATGGVPLVRRTPGMVSVV